MAEEARRHAMRWMTSLVRFVILFGLVAIAFNFVPLQAFADDLRLHCDGDGSGGFDCESEDSPLRLTCDSDGMGGLDCEEVHPALQITVNDPAHAEQVLKALRNSGQPPTKFCPVGGELFGENVKFCPNHGVELRAYQP